MRKLNFYEAGTINKLVWPATQDSFDLDLPALKVFSDFMVHTPFVAHVDANAVETVSLMRRECLHLKLVVDDDEQFLGIITMDNLCDKELLKKVAEGIEYQSLRVKDFMTPKGFIRTLDFAELEGARLGDIVLALQAEGQQHCLVIDRQQGRVRGAILAREVARRIKMPLSVQRRTSFVDIFNAVHTTSPHFS